MYLRNIRIWGIQFSFVLSNYDVLKIIAVGYNAQQVLARTLKLLKHEHGLEFDLKDGQDLSVEIYASVYILLSCVKINSQFELPWLDALGVYFHFL